MNRDTFKPFVFDSRVSRENGPHPRTINPMGYMKTFANKFDRPEICYNGGLAEDCFAIEMWTDQDYFAVINIAGEMIYKYPAPDEISRLYAQHRFIYNGLWYVIEFRIVQWLA